MRAKQFLSSKVFDLEYQTVRALSLLWFFGVLCVFLFYPPYWALMDDWGFLTLASHGFSSGSIWQYVFEFARGDFGWGMFRPMYAVFIYLFYGSFWKSSTIAYLTLYFLNAGIFFMWSLLLEKSIRSFLPASVNEPRFFRWLFFIFCFLFSPNFTLLFFASLQERLVLLFGGMALYGMFAIAFDEKRVGCVVELYLVIGVVLALLSKACALFLIPPLVAWLVYLFFQRKDGRALLLSGLLILFSIGFGFLFLSVRGSYTSDYQLSSFLNHLVHAGRRFYTPLWFSGFTIGAILIGWWLFDRARDWNRLFALLIWPSMLLSFLMVMLPWKSVINYYLIVPGGMFWTGCKVILCFLLWRLVPQSSKRFLLLAIVLIGAGVSIPSAKKFWDNAKQHHITKSAAEFLKKDLSSFSDHELLVRMPPPCYEASDAMSFFIGRPKLIRIFDPADQVFTDAQVKRKLLVLNGECEEIPIVFTPNREIFRSTPWRVLERNEALSQIKN